MKLVVATNNQGKVRELKKMLSPLGIEPVSLKDEGINIEVVEDGKTFEENARKKAREVYAVCRCSVLADDSGLEVDFLDGAPGIYSARYAGENATDKQRCDKILSELAGVPAEKRTARFVCTLCCILDDEREHIVRGTLEGAIGTAPRGENGFGYDPIFYVGDRTVAEMAEDEKNAISHRGNALRKLAEILREEQEG